MNEWMGKEAIKVIREERVKLGRGFALGRLIPAARELVPIIYILVT